MKLIDRYVYAVKQHLPSDIRDDIGKELRTNIEDMLPDNYTEEDVYQVLKGLGSPSKLADEYIPQKRYIIGPRYYSKYISTLKMVIGICIAVSLGISLLAWILESPIDLLNFGDVGKLIEDLISGSFIGLIQGVFWVTLVFVILERIGLEAEDLSFSNKEWTPNDLPEIKTNDKIKISRGETIFSMFWTILFTAILYFQPQLIAFYRIGENDNVVSTPLFNIERLGLYIPVILVLALIQLGIFVWKYIAERWNLSLIVMNMVINFIICIVTIILLIDKSLINQEFISTISVYVFETNILTWVRTSKWIFGLVIVGIYIWDSIITLVRYLKRTK